MKTRNVDVSAIEPAAYSVTGFCRAHNISMQFFYKMAAQGLGPQTFRLGTRRLVSREAAARWRTEREAATLKDEGAVAVQN